MIGQVSASHQPLVVLLDQEHAGEADQRTGRGQVPVLSTSMILEVAEKTRAVPTIGASAVRTW